MKRDRSTEYHYMSATPECGEFNKHPGKRERPDVYHFRRATLKRQPPENETGIKRETLEEFLARGGSIQTVRPGIALGAMTLSARYVRCSAVALSNTDGNSRTGNHTTS